MLYLDAVIVVLIVGCIFCVVWFRSDLRILIPTAVAAAGGAAYLMYGFTNKDVSLYAKTILSAVEDEFAKGRYQAIDAALKNLDEELIRYKTSIVKDDNFLKLYIRSLNTQLGGISFLQKLEELEASYENVDEKEIKIKEIKGNEISSLKELCGQVYKQLAACNEVVPNIVDGIIPSWKSYELTPIVKQSPTFESIMSIRRAYREKEDKLLSQGSTGVIDFGSLHEEVELDDGI